MSLNKHGNWLGEALPASTRRAFARGYTQLIDRNLGPEKTLYFINVMFNQLPGDRATQFQMMSKAVEGVYHKLTNKIVRKPDSNNWRHLRPIFIGCPDKPVSKNKKTRLSKKDQVNEGWHFNALAVVPSKSALPLWYQGRQHLLMPQQSRLKVDLVDHISEYQNWYCDGSIDRIHVVQVNPSRRMVDYTLKAFINGEITSDDIQILC